MALRMARAAKRGDRTYRYKRSIPVSYDWQGYIYFKSLLYRELPERERERIEQLCRECGGEHWRALLRFVTTDAAATKICMEHYISRSTLERMVREYYSRFPRKL